MNPEPFVGLNHLTVPVAIMASLNEHYRAARPSCNRSSEISVVLGKRIQGCATSKARFEPENYTGSHDGFNSVRAAATRDKKLPFSLARCQLHRCPTGIRTGPADFGAHIAQPDTRFWSALPRSCMNRSWVRPARIAI